MKNIFGSDTSCFTWYDFSVASLHLYSLTQTHALTNLCITLSLTLPLNFTRTFALFGLVFGSSEDYKSRHGQ